QRRQPRTDQQSAAKRILRLLAAGPSPLPGRRHPVGAGRLEPVRRRRQRRPLDLQPQRRTSRPLIRRLIGVLVLVAIVVAVVLLVSGGSSSSGYQVRAVFDNGAFMVPGEQVRVAGANVGR